MTENNNNELNKEIKNAPKTSKKDLPPVNQKNLRKKLKKDLK